MSNSQRCFTVQSKLKNIFLIFLHNLFKFILHIPNTNIIVGFAMKFEKKYYIFSCTAGKDFNFFCSGREICAFPLCFRRKIQFGAASSTALEHK